MNRPSTRLQAHVSDHELHAHSHNDRIAEPHAAISKLKAANDSHRP